MRNFLCLALTIFIFLSCSTAAQFAPAKMNKSYTSRASKNEIEIFRSRKPRKKYIEIGAVSIIGRGTGQEAADKLREKAAEKGGDAIFDLQIFNGGMTATVIRYKK